MGGIDYMELVRSQRRLKHSTHINSQLPPFALMPTNVEQLSKVVKPSTPEFWAFFDSVPLKERDGVNYAANGYELRQVYAILVRCFYREEY